MIVDVTCEDDTIQIARVIHEHEDTYTINFLEQKKPGIYDFSAETEVVPKDSISGFYDVDELEDTELYAKVQGGYELIDDSEDEDYVCSDEEEDSDEEESLIDEDEEA